MGYVENNLLKDEAIIYKAKIHWAIFLPAIIWAIIALLFYLFSKSDGDEDPFYTSFLFWAIALFCFIKELFTFISSEYVLTSKRLILKSGVIARKTVELMLTKCEGVSVDQGVFGRMLGYGTLYATTGGVLNKFKKIADPVVFRNRINEQTDVVHSSAK